MRKILVAMDVNQVNIKLVDFACYIARLTHSKLTGVFIDDLKGEETSVAEKILEASYTNLIANGVPQEFSEKAVYEENLKFFEEACKGRGVNYCMHYDKGVPIDNIITETRFADLLIVDAKMSSQKKPDGTPSDFIKEVLTKSECPVIIAPFNFDGIEEILFTYDGSPSSLFAIKQFNHLFPELKDAKVVILQINEKTDAPIIEKEKIRELIQNYYTAVEFQTNLGKADGAIFDYLLGKKNVFVVMGSFGRSMLSDFFKQSTAELIVKTIDLPYFIAHP